MRYLAILAALLAAGCATTTGLAPQQVRSGFDGARVVTIASHGNACTTVLCTGLGLEWSDKLPETAILTATVYGVWRPITGAQISVDGRVVTLGRPAGITNFSPPGDPFRISRRDFTVPMSAVRGIAASQRAWLRVQTTDGYIEHAIIDGSTDSKAYHAIGRFLAQVGPQ